MRSKYTLTAIATTALSLGMIGTAQAGTIIVPDSATASVPLSDPITQAFDQSGLSFGYTEGDDFDAYLAGSPTHFSRGGTDVRFQGTSGSITFDFGEIATLETVGLWNFSSFGFIAGAITNFSLDASLTPDFSSSTPLGSFIATPPSSNSSTAEVFTFAPTNAQFIRLSFTGNSGNPNVTAIGEVIFEESQAVPEPTTLMGLLLIGGIGLLTKRQKSIK